MSTALKILAGGVGALVLLAAGLFVTIYFGSESALRHVWKRQPAVLAVAPSPSLVAEGAQLARLYGCRDCHGDNMEGTLAIVDPGLVKVWSPNLKWYAHTHGDADFVRAMRDGIADNGRTLWAQPSKALTKLSDGELAGIIAYIRSLPVSGPRSQPPNVLEPLGRFAMVTGTFVPAAEKAQLARGQVVPDMGPQFAEGRAIARSCAECHGVDLAGDPVSEAPDLVVATGYNAEQFRRLFRESLSADGHNLRPMSEVMSTPSRFDALTDEQIEAVRLYLIARAERLGSRGGEPQPKRAAGTSARGIATG